MIKKNILNFLLLSKLLRTIVISAICFPVYGDTMEHYMNIVNAIPEMELKADQQAHLWAKSARHVLMITNESILETLLYANEQVAKQGSPFFCIPDNEKLTGLSLGDLLSQAYKNNSNPVNKASMTISEFSWLAVVQKYPCKQKAELNKFRQILQP